jgi:ABC-2 type transport system ATP-binding protein
MLCNRVAIINEGRIIALDTLPNLRGRMEGRQVVWIKIEGAVAEVYAELRQLSSVSSVTMLETTGTVWSGKVEAGPELDLARAVFEKAVARQWVLLEMKKEECSLEDVFVRLTQKEEGPA